MGLGISSRDIGNYLIESRPAARHSLLTSVRVADLLRLVTFTTNMTFECAIIHIYLYGFPCPGLGLARTCLDSLRGGAHPSEELNRICVLGFMYAIDPQEGPDKSRLTSVTFVTKGELEESWADPYSEGP